MIAALVAACASALGAGSSTDAGEAGASGPGLDTDRRGVYDERSLRLFVSRHLEAYRRATLRAEGFADSPLKLWVYENRQGIPCSATVAGQRPRARTVIAGLPVNGAFREERRPRMRKLGRHTFCAYLGPAEGTAYNTAFKSRRVRRPLLRARRARRTVAAALRRHDFAHQVIEHLEQRCRRRSRSRFSCRFSSAFPGYSLSGRGSVKLKKHVSYRFRVHVQGRTLTLTDENEGRFPG